MQFYKKETHCCYDTLGKIPKKGINMCRRCEEIKVFCLSFVGHFHYTLVFCIQIYLSFCDLNLIRNVDCCSWKGQDVSETKNHKKTLSYFFVSHTQRTFLMKTFYYMKKLSRNVYETSHIVGLSQSNNHNKSFNLLLFCCRWVNKCWLSFSISFLPSNIFISLL